MHDTLRGMRTSCGSAIHRLISCSSTRVWTTMRVNHASLLSATLGFLKSKIEKLSVTAATPHANANKQIPRQSQAPNLTVPENMGTTEYSAENGPFSNQTHHYPRTSRQPRIHLNSVQSLCGNLGWYKWHRWHRNVSSPGQNTDLQVPADYGSNVPTVNFWVTPVISSVGTSVRSHWRS